MKRLSREERIGAIWLATAVVIALVLTFTLRTCRSGPAADGTSITIVYKDTVSQRQKSAKKEKKKVRSGTAVRKAKKKQARKASAETAPRDFLSDTIPIKQEVKR